MWRGQLTCNAGKQLPSEALNLAIGEGHKAVALEKVKDTLAEEVHDYADMSPVVEAVPQVDASIPVIIIIRLQCGEYPKFDSRGISVFLHRSDDLDRNGRVASSITGLHNFAERALAKQARDLVLSRVSRVPAAGFKTVYSHFSVSSASGTTM